MTILRQYIQTLLFEKIRSTSQSKTFNLRRFKDIAIIADEIRGFDYLYNYASKRLKLLGEGSSRIVYLLSSQKVLKIATGPKGVAQNEVEIDVYTNPKTRPIIAKIFDYDPKFKWIISELVKEQSDSQLFQKLNLQHDIYFDSMIADLDDNENSIDEVVSKYGKYGGSAKLRNFLEALRTTMWENDLLPGDIAKPSHFGQTASGNIVLLDYGFTENVHEDFYSDEDENYIEYEKSAKGKTASND